MTIIAKFLLSFLISIIIIVSNLFAQTIVPEYGDVNISPDNFVTGVGRRCAMDVQKSTGKTVYVYTEKDANPATTKDIWCVIYNSDMTIAVNPFRINNNVPNDQLAPFVLVHQNDNSFFVTWYSNHNGTDNNIYAKKISFDVTDATSANVTAAADIIINDITSGEQVVPIITISYKYNEVIFAFRDQSNNDGGGSGSQGVYAKRLSVSDLSVSISNQFLVHTSITANQVLNAIDTKGDYMVVSYTSNHITANAHDLYARVYIITDPPGAAPVTYTKDNEFLVNNYLSGDQNNSHLAINETTGEFAITWSSSQDGSGFGVYSKIYKNNPFTLIKDEFLVNSVTANNELLSKVVWEESTKQLMYFFHYSLSTLGTLKYRIFDGMTIPGQYNPVDVDKDLIGGVDTKSYYNQFYNVCYNSYTNRLNLVYDMYDTYSTFNSKSRARTFIFKHPNLATPSFLNSTDLDRNWIHSRSYGEDGTLISESRQYYDSLGSLTQSQSRNISEVKILASMPIYDVFNRPVINTLTAPITEQLFTFKNNFISPNGASSRYSYNDFDKPNTINNLAGEVNNPKPVDVNSLLGNYYSNNNTYEQYVGTTSFPYSRVVYNDNISGGVVSASSSGEALKIGSGHEVKAISLPILNELDHYLQFKKDYFGASDIPLTTLAFNGTKTVQIDQNGIETITFNDNEGLLIATARANGSSNTAMQAKLSSSISFYNIAASPYLTVSNIKISSSSALIEVWNMCTNTLIFSGYENDFNVLNNTFNCDFQVRSLNSFKVSYKTTNNIGVINDYYNLYSSDIIGNSVVDLYIKNPSSLALVLNDPASVTQGTLNIKVINLSDGKVIYNGNFSSFSNSLLPVGSGFYRIQIESIPLSYAYDPNTFNLSVNYNFPYSDFAYLFYDMKGKVVSSVAPNGVIQSSSALPKFKKEYTYTSLGMVLSINDPDNGLTEYVYRKDGSVRFLQDAKQRVNGKFSYKNIDILGRIVESGEYNPALVASNAKVFIGHRSQETAPSPGNPNSVHQLLENTTLGGGLESVGRTQVHYISYDLSAADALRSQRYTRLRISSSYNKNLDTDVNYINKSWYSYDERGRVVWMDQSLTGLGNKTIDYTYTKELLTNVIYQKNTLAERFEHKYSYDAMQRLKKVETAAGAALFRVDGQYYYYLHGPLKRKELGGNVQGIDYVYTLQGWLKSINHPELSSTKDPGKDGTVGSLFYKDVFGMSFDYYNNDYVRTGASVNSTTNSSLNSYAQNFNGIIRAINWQTEGNGISGNPAQYAYTYDAKYQLLTAAFGYNDASGTKNFVADINNKYGSSASYDLNGNLLTLITDKGALPDDSYSYSYSALPDANKLNSITNGNSSNDNRVYQYDEIGQLINETKGSGTQKSIIYDVYRRVKEVRDAANVLKVSFVYNERSQRIKKITYGTTPIVTWYILDASGNVLSIYDDKSGSMVQTEIPIVGTERIGVVQKSASSLAYTYELKDHLGNVRALVDGNGTVISWTDYLPFGEVNAERVYVSPYGRRYECQGEFSEYDVETEWNAFDLRMYDARIGRWLTTDPYGQHWSPYLAMSNNPVNNIDPSGGIDFGSVVVAVATNAATNIISQIVTSINTGGAQVNGNTGITDFQAWMISFDEVTVEGVGSIDISSQYQNVSSYIGSFNTNYTWGEGFGDGSMIEYRFLQWLKNTFLLKDGFVLYSKDSYAGSSEETARTRGKDVGKTHTVDVDNITRVFGAYSKGGKLIEFVLNRISNGTVFAQQAEEALTRYGAKDRTSLSPGPIKIDTFYIGGDTIYKNPQNGDTSPFSDSLNFK